MAAGSRLALLALFAALCCCAPGGAQQLARLHVLGMTLSSSTPRPNAGVPFDLIVTIRVRENVASLDNVVLPAFAGPEELGDERVVSHGAGGTLYRETLRLVAHNRGPLAIGPAYLDAIDARDGRPKRFLSNNLNLTIEGGALFDPWNGVRGPLLAFAKWVAAAAAIAAILLVLRRRPRPAPPEQRPVSQAPAAAPLPSAETRLQTAFAALAADPTRDSLRRVRALLWECSGVPEGATLADALSACGHMPADVRAVLTAVERATFVEDWQFADAVARVLRLREVPA